MVEGSNHAIITAISDSNFEGFVSSNLHSQGWDIVARSVDIASLQAFLSHNPEAAKNSILIYAPDLPGFSNDTITVLRTQVRHLIGYGTESELAGFPFLSPRPSDPAELVSQIRSVLRREFREPLISSQKGTNLAGAKVIAIGSAGSATGATTLAINLAMESSLLEKRTLLIDGNSFEPTISIALELRNLRADQNPRLISQLLWAYELTETKSTTFVNFMTSAYVNFDLIVIDLGSISNLAIKLTDRRWTSQCLIWSSDNCDEIWINSRPDEVGRFRLARVIKELNKNKIKARLQFVANLEVPRRRNDQGAHELAEQIDQLNPINRLTLPRDNRAVAAAATSYSSLSEASPKSMLRKAIFKIASDI
jgi:Mrp family chromosome partitioning ATPase